MNKLTVEEIESQLKAALEYRQFNRIKFFQPYEKQQDFYDLGATKRERMLSAGNQQGKTECGAAEIAFHATGNYPIDWLGRRFKKPPRIWVAGESSVLVRDVQQKKLMGPPGVDAELGTGFIPRDKIVDKSLARGVTDAYDTVQVKHASGGVCTITFKSYEQGRTKFQGEPVDIIWLDEECPMDVYMECLTRTNATGGMVLITYTPLKGKTELTERFFSEKNPDRALIQMTIMDAKHISAEERAKIIASYPSHEREARVNGIPMLGSGRIFPPEYEAMISIAAIEFAQIPTHWAKFWSIDFGLSDGHKFAAVLWAWDKDNDILYIIDAFKLGGGNSGENLPDRNARRMRSLAAMVPVAWPHDGHRTEAGSSGVSTAKLYKAEGLLMHETHATFPEGGYSTEAGILALQQRMALGRLKVFSHLTEFFDEFRQYHRKDGLIVKARDDIMSAMRVGIMMMRIARPVALGGSIANRKNRNGGLATGLDFDLFGS